MSDWEQRYQTGDMPWEKGAPSPGLVDFLAAHPDLPRELAAVAVSLWGVIGGLVLMAAWRGWEVFYK